MTEAATTRNEPIGAPGKPKKKRRVFLWFFLAVQVLFVIWIIAGANSGGDSSCKGLTGSGLQSCKDAGDVGTGIGIALIVILWFFIDAFLAVVYGVYRLAKRRD